MNAFYKFFDLSYTEKVHNEIHYPSERNGWQKESRRQQGFFSGQAGLSSSLSREKAKYVSFHTFHSTRHFWYNTVHQITKCSSVKSINCRGRTVRVFAKLLIHDKCWQTNLVYSHFLDFSILPTMNKPFLFQLFTEPHSNIYLFSHNCHYLCLVFNSIPCQRDSLEIWCWFRRGMLLLLP